MLQHKIIAIGYLIFAISVGAVAQRADRTHREEISGVVKTVDGEPAESISVLLKNTNYGAITDENGQFKFEAPAGEYTLVVYSILAHKREHLVTIKEGGSNHFPDLTVFENKNQLDEVVVTGQFTPQSLRNSLYKVRVINNQTIQQKAAVDIKSLLNTELGIRISNDAALGESNIELMGMSGNNIKVLVDGVPLVDRGATKQSISQIDINTIEQIEIVEGPMSVIYGTDALAGVINIITKKEKPTTEKNSYSIAARIQEESIGNEYKPLTGSGVHNQSLTAMWASKVGVYVNGGYTRNTSGGWIGTKSGREKSWTPRDQYYYQGTVGYKKKGLNVWYRLNYLDETIYTPINPVEARPNEVVDRDFLTDRYTHSLQADWKLNNRLGLNIVSSYQDYERRTRTAITNRTNGQRWLSTDEAAQDVAQYNASFARATAAWRVNSKWSVQPGVEYNWDKGAGGRIKGEPIVTTVAAFLSAEWKPFEWLSFRPGVRAFLYTDYKAPVAIPSIGAKVSLHKDIDLRLSYASGFRAPTLQELYFSFHNASHNIDGNPNLKAESSQNVSGSFTWRVLHNEQVRLTSTLSGFYNDFTDRITLAVSESDPTHTTYRNIDKYKTTGGTLENALVWQNLRASLSVSAIGRYNNLSESDAYRERELPKFRFSPEVSSTISYHINRSGTTLNLFYKYTGSRQEYRVNFTTGELYLGGLEGYHTADISVSQNAGKYLIVNAGVKNLFNVTTVNGITNEGAHGASGTASLIGSGRALFVGVNFLLNNNNNNK